MEVPKLKTKALAESFGPFHLKSAPELVFLGDAGKRSCLPSMPRQLPQPLHAHRFFRHQRHHRPAPGMLG